FQTKAIPVLRDDPGFQDLSGGNFQNSVFVSGPGGTRSINAWGLSALRGNNVVPTMLEGRWPERSDEIALGRTSLRDLGVGLDDRVLVSVAGKQLEMTVVGVPVFPDLGFGPGFGQGAGLTIEGLRVFYPGLTEGLVLGRYAPGVVEQDVLDRVNPALKPF